MARIYAGILGPLALFTSLAHGALHARPAAAVVFDAWLALLAFAPLGYVIGWIAERVVVEEARGRVAEPPSAESFSASPG